MGLIDRIMDIIGVMFNRRFLSRTVLGEINLDKGDIERIIPYLENREKNNEGRNILINQLEQNKHPILKELLTRELDVILSNNATLGDLQKFAVAKGGYAKGIGSIVWNDRTERYTYKNNSRNKCSLIFLSIIIFFILFLALTPLFEYSHMLFLAIPLFFFTLYVLCAGSVNKDAGKYLKNKFPHLFET